MTTMIEKLILEINKNPESALQLAETLRKIAGPWVVENSQFLIRNMQGQEVAHISVDYPKWKVVINGEIAKDAPFIMHAKDIITAKVFVEEKLREQGYIVANSAEIDSE